MKFAHIMMKCYKRKLAITFQKNIFLLLYCWPNSAAQLVKAFGSVNYNFETGWEFYTYFKYFEYDELSFTLNFHCSILS